MESKREVKVKNCLLVFKQGDITLEDVDVIVNAANSRLAGGGGVDGAIRRAGGPVIAEECNQIIKRIGRLETGEAVATSAGNLKAKYVVHTVGPIWSGGKSGEPEKLYNAYFNSLKLAKEKGAKTIAFPSISTGIYGYPVEDAAPIAIKAVLEFLEKNDHFDEVRFVLFDSRTYQAYVEAAEKAGIF